MEKIFFITAMLFNAETLELEPKFNQSVWFYNRINCESYVQQNFTILHDGLQLYLDMEGDEREITGGWYATEDGTTTSVAHWLEEDDFRKNGGVMNHETVESISKRKKPFTVDYTGFGWVCIKNGVFEKLPYPWFAPKMQVFESGAVQDMCGEDVSFCLDAIEEGFEIWCDPRIRVGHEKTRII